ncbi:hypothetical protein Ancab_017538 [Ancistrocladus abbreviatus]
MPHLTSDVIEPKFEYDPASYVGHDDTMCFPSPMYEEFLYGSYNFSCLGSGEQDSYKGAFDSNESAEIFSKGREEHLMSTDYYFRCLWAGSWIFNGNDGSADGSVYELEKVENPYHDEGQLVWHNSDKSVGDQPAYDHYNSHTGNVLRSKFAEEDHDDAQDGDRPIYSYIMDESGLCQWLFGNSSHPSYEFQESYADLKADEQSHDDPGAEQDTATAV